jgi:uncharacterized protein (DUF305 family)
MKRAGIISAAVAAVIIAAAVAIYVSAGDGDDAAKPSAVDIGFAQDMVVHHQQAVLMGAYTRQHAESDAVRSLAGAIDSAQQREIGQMVGWLQSWGVPVESDGRPMSWMGSGMAHEGHEGHPRGSMPGMASPAEMDQLVNLTGPELDRQFLKLMTRHHEGGLPMAKYAATHARMSYVRDAARTMVSDQQREIDLMRTLTP